MSLLSYLLLLFECLLAIDVVKLWWIKLDNDLHCVGVQLPAVVQRLFKSFSFHLLVGSVHNQWTKQ